MRHCIIEFADVEDETGAGDGAYDLHDVEGSPEAIGRAIADALAETDLGPHDEPGAIAKGGSLLFTVKVRVRAGDCQDVRVTLDSFALSRAIHYGAGLPS